MSKVLKILSIMIIIMMVICSFTNSSYALNMNLEENTTADTNTSTNGENRDSSYGKSNITTQITVSTQELTISNALSICLIAVGVVIILLAIAILIKLKN